MDKKRSLKEKKDLRHGKKVNVCIINIHINTEESGTILWFVRVLCFVRYCG